MASAASQHCYEINLQAGAGGGEIYTKFFTEALVGLGWSVSLITKRGSWLARNLQMPQVTLREVDSLEDVPAVLTKDGAPVFSHHPFLGPVADAIRQGHRLVFFAHMPLYGRNAAPFAGCDLILAVSHHVIDSLKAAGLAHYYADPLYGVADLARGASSEKIVRGSVYDWDRRKFRERCLSLVYPIYQRMRPEMPYTKRSGVTLGIVSRLTPIKQFPLLFSHLAPVLAQYPNINLEIFGSGGYASVRDLRRALRPAMAQVRFWGHQHDVASVYRQIDWLMTGLPEKEALGLNVIEAQACGTPVLAVNAPPFTETVLNEKTGLLYTDPRQDQGQDFRRALERLLSSPAPRPLDHPAHLEQFSQAAFRRRVERLMDQISTEAA
jgi:glycosyltransferase involved in cell wall biosynthesis